MPIVASTTAHDFWEWVREQGYAGCTSEQLRQVLAADGYTSGNNNIDLWNWLTANGFTQPTMTEKITAFERANTVEY